MYGFLFEYCLLVFIVNVFGIGASPVPVSDADAVRVQYDHSVLEGIKYIDIVVGPSLIKYLNQTLPKKQCTNSLVRIGSDFIRRKYAVFGARLASGCRHKLPSAQTDPDARDELERPIETLVSTMCQLALTTRRYPTAGTDLTCNDLFNNKSTSRDSAGSSLAECVAQVRCVLIRLA
jgi:hypothetical protein